MTTTDKLPFPPNLPPLPEPPAGHEWEYRGMGASIPEGRKYICGDEEGWDKEPSEGGSMADEEFHYAEAVPVSTEPDYQDRAYQKKILDAAWEGVPCQWLYLEEWVDFHTEHDDPTIQFREIVKSLIAKNPIRIKPPTPTKKRIPLTAEDIPAVCWVRHPKWNSGCGNLVVSVETDYLIQYHGHKDTYQKIMDEGWEYSSDRRNWKPCYVEVEG